MNDKICFAEATKLARRIRNKEVSPVEVLEAHLERIESVNPKINAIVTMAPSAMDEARAAEAAVVRGDALGPIHGVPFTIKDGVDTAGILTTRGSRLFADRVPDTDAPVVTRLKRAGGILVGKTNMPEFALWGETDNDVFGRTANPWNADRTAGGSSGGESAALAAGLTPLGTGDGVLLQQVPPAPLPDGPGPGPSPRCQGAYHRRRDRSDQGGYEYDESVRLDGVASGLGPLRLEFGGPAHRGSARRTSYGRGHGAQRGQLPGGAARRHQQEAAGLAAGYETDKAGDVHDRERAGAQKGW